MHILNSTTILERRLGDTEASYFLPSREDGVNDMYLHLGFRAPVDVMNRQCISLVWSILRIRHPLLASRVEMHDYEDVRFIYTPPNSPEEALKLAEFNLEYRSQTKDELLDSYLNGPRTLSASRLSHLIISVSETKDITENDPSNLDTAVTVLDHDLLICATHFLGDGMALHQFANEFFSLLGTSDLKGLQDILTFEWQERCYKKIPVSHLPTALEDRLPGSSSAFQRLASRVDFQNSQTRLIGGQAFPKRSSKTRQTVVPTVSFDEERTKKILKACKAHGVSISSALFAICNFAWARTSDRKWELPMMMYSALNLRPYLSPDRMLSDSYWFISIGYFNVILPTFLPKDGNLARTFWHRARSAKEQSTDAVKHPMLISRSREMARERGARARVWAKEDDEKALGIWKPTPKTPNPVASARAPSMALIGLSLLGNLDGIYKHARYPDITLHTLTTGSRQRPGGMLLFGYTFVGKLWISLGYDTNGFEEGVVERFWGNTLQCIDELLV